jgi:rhamnosyltransferase
MKPTTTCILMATYNGARYVEQQITSIQQQTLQEWTLLVRDDGSTDNTLEKVRFLAEQDRRIQILEGPGESTGGAAQNFSQLMEAGLKTQSHIFFLCDQDDVWGAGKLQRQVQAFPDLGAEKDSLLVHSDLSVVDESLKPIHPSMVAYMALDVYPAKPFNHLLSRNFVTGCATACNRRLLEEAIPIPQQAIMHDWWLALVAAANGTISFIDEALINYRQHSTNTIGVKGFWQGLNPTRNWLEGWRAGNEDLLETFAQACALLAVARNNPEWPQTTIVDLEKYTQLLQRSTVQRLKGARELGLGQGRLLLTAMFFVRLITLRSEKITDRQLV